LIFLRADLSQAESRVVNVLSHDEQLIKLARSKPWEFDSHRYLAGLIFNCDPKDVTHDQRYATKKVVHGTNYDMQPERMSDSMLKEGFIFSAAQCQTMQKAYLDKLPAIRDGYQYRARMKCIERRYLENSWGRRIYFTYERLGPELNRRLYAWTPQSEIGDLLNQNGFIPCHQFIEKYNLKSRINLQVHDEVAASVNIEEGWDLMRLLRDSLEQEREYEGVKLIVPVEFALEVRYHSETVEFKKFPSCYEEYLIGANKVWEQRIK